MKRLLLCWMLTGCSFADAQDGWTGEVIFDVTPGQADQGQWDYIPHTVTYQTDGQAWRILEQGTSFERIWLGAHGAPTHHILFHFLGHAVELEERCTGEPIAQFEWGPVPCPWSIDASRSLLFVNDGPVRYELKERSVRAVRRSEWDRKHFGLPRGYEPIDKPGLAALLQSLGRSLD